MCSSYDSISKIFTDIGTPRQKMKCGIIEILIYLFAYFWVKTFNTNTCIPDSSKLLVGKKGINFIYYINGATTVLCTI